VTRYQCIRAGRSPSPSSGSLHKGPASRPVPCRSQIPPKR
jgi:hypothetical protein